MEDLYIKHIRFTFEEWTGTKKKNYKQCRIENREFKGFIGLIQVEEVEREQLWEYKNEYLKVCVDGTKWLIITPEDGKFSITMFLDKERPVVWYIDLIDGVGTDDDGIFYYNDIFLDLLVYTDGIMKEEDRDELEAALQCGVIDERQYRQANQTAEYLRDKIQKNFNGFKKFCFRRLDEINSYTGDNFEK